jgi:hypothetical protein
MGKVAVALLLSITLFAGAAPGQTGASSYVPMDDWVYPVLDRMIARGEIDIVGSGIRPWTRMQIASLLKRCQRCESPEHDALRKEFGDELNGNRFRLDSVYARSEQIVGTPLNNSFDYGQTVVNDFGRPNRKGQNLVAGLHAYSESRWITSAIGMEYQQSGADSVDARQLIASLDGAAVGARWSVASIKRFRMLEGYAGSRSEISNLLSESKTCTGDEDSRARC